jgi:hypothetical protein
MSALTTASVPGRPGTAMPLSLRTVLCPPRGPPDTPRAHGDCPPLAETTVVTPSSLAASRASARCRCARGWSRRFRGGTAYGGCAPRSSPCRPGAVELMLPPVSPIDSGRPRPSPMSGAACRRNHRQRPRAWPEGFLQPRPTRSGTAPQAVEIRNRQSRHKAASRASTSRSLARSARRRASWRRKSTNCARFERGYRIV